MRLLQSRGTSGRTSMGGADAEGAVKPQYTDLEKLADALRERV